MIKVKKKIKKADVDTATTFIFENGITVILSWVEESFLDEWVIMIMAVPEDRLELLNTQTYFRK